MVQRSPRRGYGGIAVGEDVVDNICRIEPCHRSNLLGTCNGRSVCKCALITHCNDNKTVQARGKKTALIVAGGVVALAVIVLYATYNPAHSYLAPKCPVFLLTGWECPSCGIQRALHSILTGEWGLALRYNPFLCLSIPYALIAMWGAWGKGYAADKCSRFAFHRYTLWTYIALFFGWWIFRNTELWHSIANLP